LLISACLQYVVIPRYMRDLFVILSDLHARATRFKDAFILKLPLIYLRVFIIYLFSISRRFFEEFFTEKIYVVQSYCINLEACTDHFI
jgi:hypothetical protein